MSSQPVPQEQISDEEILSRFILFKRFIRSDNKSIKADAFIPPSDLNLSVTASSQLSEEEIWKIGKDVAEIRSGGELYGRADLTALNVRSQNLQAIPAPLPTNIYHAHVIDWPTEKPAQKIIALELANASRFIPF
ncbi:MAG: hypothetical protein WAV76_04790 [Bacteroidota bacterium]